MLNCFGPTIEILLADNNMISELNRKVFQRFTNLKWLSLDNTGLVKFDFNIIASKKIEILTVSSNHLKYIEGATRLKTFTRLYDLKLMNNELNNTPEIIRNLPQHLSTLDLSNNFIGELNETTFENFTNLRWLSLENTNLKISNFNPFKRLRSLSLLYISYNNLENVNFAIMSNTLIILSHFRNAYCKIKSISQVIKQFGDKIRSLDLSGNFADAELNADLFKPLINLGYLNSSDTNMLNFASDTLQYLNSIQAIDVSYNGLHEIDLQLFPKQTANIHLNGNKLISVNNLNRDHLFQLNRLEITKNCMLNETITEIKRTLRNVSFFMNPFVQKNDIECDRMNESTSNSNTNVISDKNSGATDVTPTKPSIATSSSTKPSTNTPTVP